MATLSNFEYQPISQALLAEKERFNSNNHSQYAPFNVDGEKRLIIDPAWFEHDVIPQSQKLILAEAKLLGAEVVFAPVSVPHDIPDLSELMSCVYRNYLYQYEYHHWGPALPERFLEFAIHRLSRADLLSLKELSAGSSITGNPISRTVATEEFSTELWTTLEQWVQRWGELFVKLSSTSGKNDRDLTPLTSALDVLRFLTNSRLLLKEYDHHLRTPRELSDKTMAVVGMKWNREIAPEREWRVFVRTGRTIAMAQQSWYKNFHFETEYVHRCSESIAMFCNDIVTHTPFSSAVMDVWVDANLDTHLIECNPWGCYGSSGSSLFHWMNDKQILVDERTETDPIVVRYVVE